MQRLQNWRRFIGVSLMSLLLSCILLIQASGQVFSKSHSGMLVTSNKSIFAFPLIKYPNGHNVRSSYKLDIVISWEQEIFSFPEYGGILKQQQHFMPGPPWA